MSHSGKTGLTRYLAAGLLLLLCVSRAAAVETDCVIHDPSAIIKSGGAYWVFGTGRGIAVYSSPDMRHWTPQPPVFTADPTWIAAAVPGHRPNDYWAPDIRFIRGRYCLYYAVSAFGRNTSAIGLATSPSLQSPHWTDHGSVFRSGRADNYNAIDPCVIRDARGGLWMSFGSFWSGIKLIKLDRATGAALPGASPVYSLAAHPQDPSDSIEASYITAHRGYYYLFVNWGLCCRGQQSTYSILVGRSRAITGPYLDRDGHDMRTGGGSPFLGTVAENGPGRQEVGPGQAGVFSDADGDWFTCHYEWAQDRQGLPLLNIQKLIWDSDDWPAPAAP